MEERAKPGVTNKSGGLCVYSMVEAQIRGEVISPPNESFRLIVLAL